MRQPKRAVEVLEPALAQHPEDTQIMAMLGNAYLQTGRYQEGSDLLSKAVEINPGGSRIANPAGVWTAGSGQDQRRNR